jgi:hypothetical protein
VSTIVRRERRRIADLIPAPYNPRRITEAALNGLMDSIGRFGQVQDIVVNERSGYVIGGHQRAVAMATMGHTECWVTFVDLDETAEKQLNVALNSPHLAGQFTDGLASLLSEIRGIDPDAFGELRFDALMPKGGKSADEPPAEPSDKPEALKFLVTERQRLTIDQALDTMRNEIDKPGPGKRGDHLRNGLMLEALCAAYLQARAQS